MYGTTGEVRLETRLGPDSTSKKRLLDVNTTSACVPGKSATETEGTEESRTSGGPKEWTCANPVKVTSTRQCLSSSLRSRGNNEVLRTGVRRRLEHNRSTGTPEPTLVLYDSTPGGRFHDVFRRSEKILQR